MSTQVKNQNDKVVMQRNATASGSWVTVCCSVNEWANSSENSVERQMVEMEDGRTMRAWEALEEMSKANRSNVSWNP